MIRSRSRTTKWNLFFHYTSIALALVSGIVMVPLYLYFIPLHLYGAWLATGNILAWLTVVDPGLSTVLQQRAGVAYGRGDIAELSALLSGGIFLSGMVFLLVLAIGLSISGFITVWLSLNLAADIQVVEQAFVLAVIGSAFMIFSYGLTAFNQGLQSSLGIGLVFVLATIIGLVITIVLLYKGMGLLSLPIGLIVRAIGLTIGNAGYLIWRSVEDKIGYNIDFKGIVNLARLSSYTFFGRTAVVIADNMDAFVLTRYLSPEIATAFVLTRKAPGTSRMFLERPAVAFMPAVSSLVGAGEIERAKVVLLRLLRMILWLLGLIAGGFFLFNDDFVSLWVGSDLFAGKTINIFIVLILIVTVIASVLSNLCFSLGNIKGNSIASLAQGLIAVPLMILGARYWGMLGVAIAHLVAMLAISVWYYPIAFSRVLKLSRKDISIMVREGSMVLASTATAIVALLWSNPQTWLTFVLSVATFGSVYMAILAALSPGFRIELINRIK